MEEEMYLSSALSNSFLYFLDRSNCILSKKKKKKCVCALEKWCFILFLFVIKFYRWGNVPSAHSFQTETKFSLFHLKVNWPNHLYQLKLSSKAKQHKKNPIVISLRNTEKHSQITEQKCGSSVWKKEDTALTRTVVSLCWFLFLQWWPWQCHVPHVPVSHHMKSAFPHLVFKRTSALQEEG